MSRFHALVALVLLLVARNASALISYDANLSGPSESPPNASPGIGFAEVDYDPVAHTMRVQVTFSGLLGVSTASHIHAPTAVAFTGTSSIATQTPTFTGFPLGVTSGTYDHTFDLTQESTYNATFGDGVPADQEAALFASVNAGTAYLNIHSTVVPGGEIRGFLVPVPEPGCLALIGCAGLIAARRRAR